MYCIFACIVKTIAAHQPGLLQRRLFSWLVLTELSCLNSLDILTNTTSNSSWLVIFLFLLPRGSPWCLWGRWGPGHWQSSSSCCHSGCPAPDAWLQGDTQRKREFVFPSAHGKFTRRRKEAEETHLPEFETAERVSGEEAIRPEPPVTLSSPLKSHTSDSISSSSTWTSCSASSAHV